MESPTLEHSDSDSGESWTLLDHISGPVDDAPNQIDTQLKSEKKKLETHEKDEDTDGISIISDSDPESSSPCQLQYETLYEEDQDFHHLSQCPFNLAVPVDHHKDDNDFLSIDHGKHKTYVHRRNKRLSTVLNIIVLGSVITAAGVAIGHMWGAKSDCSMNTIPNVNNILSNLYKLQEENAYLRNKVKELTALNSQQHSQVKGPKHNRCKRVFEESLNNDKVKSIKCVDDKVDFSGILHKSDNKFPESIYKENDFKENINTLKDIYQENKNWLDDEIVLRLQQEHQSRKRIKRSQHATKLQKINEEKDSKPTSQNKDNIVKGMDKSDGQNVTSITPKIISYADSLKSFNDLQKDKLKINNSTTPYHENRKNRQKKVTESGFESPISEEEIVKDSRYVSPKFKQERKKNDRPKTYKKQKRRNKYEQWEMKGGFMKDYDDVPLSRDADSISNDPNLQEKIEKRCIVINKQSRNNDYITQDCNFKFDNKKAPRLKSNRDELNFPNSRSSYRADMKRLEEGLFGGEGNPAGWYFRRMHKREQCRAKANNTNQKFSKRNMNYKMKH